MFLSVHWTVLEMFFERHTGGSKSEEMRIKEPQDNRASFLEMVEMKQPMGGGERWFLGSVPR